MRPFPRRGEVYWIDLDPTVGSEMRKTRPCVVVTNNILNERRHTVVIIPLSTTSPKKFPLYVPLPSVGDTSQAVVDQIRVVDKQRVGERLGELLPSEIEKVEEAMKRVLDLD